MDTPTPKTPDTVESSINFDVARGIVTITPKKVNGVTVLNPVAATLSVDQWLEIAAKLILGRAELRNQMTQHAPRVTGLIKP